MKTQIIKFLMAIFMIFPLVISNSNYTFADESTTPSTTAPTTESTKPTLQNQQDYLDAIKDLQSQLASKEQQSNNKKDEDAKPNIKLISTSTFSAKAGQKNTIEFEIKNTTSYTAKNLIIQATLADSSTIPFTMEFVDGSNNISALGPQSSKKVKLILDIDDLAEAKRYDINLEYIYSNSYNIGFTTKDTISIKVENKLTTSSLVSLSDFKLSAKTIKPDSSVELTAMLQNLGKQAATDIQLVVDGLSTDTLSITNNTNSLYYARLEPESKSNITFNISAAKNIKQGNYPLTFKITYKDSAGKEQTNSQTFFISSEGSAETEKSFVQIQNLTVPTEIFVVGKSFIIHLDVLNTGKAIAKNIKITAEYGTDGAVIPKSPSIQMVNSLEAGAEKGFDFTFAATSTAKSQNYPISFKLEYEDGSEGTDGVSKTITYTQYTGVNISNPEADKKEEDSTEKAKSIPKIIISEYSCDPIMVKAGEEFNLNMSFTNTHVTKKVNNIKIFFTVSEESKTGNVFIPVDSSNTFYIDNIAPKGTVSKVVRLFAMPDAEAKTYNLIVNFEYEDDNGVLPVSTENIGISVKQPTKLETSDIAIPTDAFVGEPVYVNFDLYNTGKVTLNNLMVKITGDFETQNSNSYYGNFESGNSEYFEGTIIPKTEGSHTGKVIISYDEPSGERVEKITEISLNVSAPMVSEAFSPDGKPMTGDMGMEEPKKGFVESIKFFFATKGIIAIISVIGGVIAVIAVVVGIIIFIKRRKKQKGMDLDD